VAKFLTSSPDEKDISTALDEVLADWAEPVMAGLRLGVNRQDVKAAGREVLRTEARESLIDLSDLPAGRTIWVAGRVPRGDISDLTFRVITKDNQEVATCRLDIAKEAIEHDALKALFGARRVLGLEFLIHSGYDPKDLLEQLERLGYDSEKVLSDLKGKPPKVYAENVREEATEALRSLLLREALDYGIACSETAFVAVRREAGKLVEGSVAVANALPAGWSEEFLYSSRRMYRAGRISTSVAQPVEYMELAQPMICSLRSPTASPYGLRMAAMSPSTPRASVSMIQETPAGLLRTKAKKILQQISNGFLKISSSEPSQNLCKLDHTVGLETVNVMGFSSPSLRFFKSIRLMS
jgi:Ca-activated chloride channel family protein